MTNDERDALVEEATAGLAAFDEYWGGGGPVEAPGGRPWELIRRFLAVFEQAHTAPEDTAELAAFEKIAGTLYRGKVDEIAALRRIERELRTLRTVVKDYDANFPCDGGCNVNDGPEETCSRHGRSPRDLWDRLDAALRRPVQGEPTHEGHSFCDPRLGCVQGEPTAETVHRGTFGHVWPCPLFYVGNWKRIENGHEPVRDCSSPAACAPPPVQGEPIRMLLTHPHDGHGESDTCMDCVQGEPTDAQPKRG